MGFFKVLVVVVLVFPAMVWAAGSSGKAKIGFLYQRSSDGLIGIYKEGGSWNNPDDCDSSDRVVLVREGNESRGEFYSAILATKMAGSDFQAYLSGCIAWNGVTYPQVVGVYTY